MYSEHLLVDRGGSAMQTQLMLELGKSGAQASWQGYYTLQEGSRRVIYEAYGITFKRQSRCLCGGIPGGRRAPKTSTKRTEGRLKNTTAFCLPKAPHDKLQPLQRSL